MPVNQLTPHEQKALLFVTVALILGSGIKAFGWSNDPATPAPVAAKTPNVPADSGLQSTPQPLQTPRSKPRGSTKPMLGTMNLNAADAKMLQRLPGVGPVIAERIVAYRFKVGAFKTLDQLLKVEGVGKAKLKKMAPHLTL